MNFRKVVVLVCVLLLMIGIPIKVYSEDKESKHIVLIDPGHGGIDGGAKSKNGTIEKDLNLDISNKLKDCLEESGYIVYMTRNEDTQLDKSKRKDLGLRCSMKKETNCEVFISIHQNMFPQSNCFGSQVWYSSNEKSKTLADIVQNSLKENVGDNNKRVAKAAKEQYKILRDGYDGACILVECGFLSNPDEEQRLKDSSHQDKLVNAIKLGLEKYFQES